MPKFEIFIPKSPKVPMDLNLRLDAESWTEALKLGRQKVGEGGEISDKMMCDIMDDNSIHVTDMETGRVFRIVEIGEAPADIPTAPPLEEPAPAEEDARPTEPQMPAVQPPAPATEPAPPPAAAPAETPTPVAVPTAPRRPQTLSGIGRVVDGTSEATADFLEDVFERTQEVYARGSREEALYYLLDLAMDRVGTESGSVLLADINQYDLYFGAARGEKAAEVMKFRVPMGKGIAGFSAETGVGLAVSDVNRDPRFYAVISERIGYPTRSIMSVPMQMEGQVLGVVELINKKDNDSFTERELHIASFIAHQLAEYLHRNR